MRKKVLLVLFTGIFLLSNALIASAQTLIEPEQNSLNGSEIIETTHYNVETDINKLYERAKKGISDAPDPKNIINTKPVLKDSEGNEKEIIPIQTTQLIKTEKKSNNEIVNTYASTSFVELKDQDLKKQTEQKNGTFSIMGTGTWYDDGYGETSYSVLGYDTLVYEKVSADLGVYKYRIIRTYGGFQILDSSVSINYQTIHSAANGCRDNNPVFPKNIDYGYTYKYGKMTFDITYPNKGYVWDFPQSSYSMWLETVLSCNLYRGGSSWYFSWTNEY